ncbi:MAG: hypothetical protein EOM78_11565 [Erysipelotrichia bacterium]|nr:hypothetical protein [Erysipelotrichia bacterium]
MISHAWYEVTGTSAVQTRYKSSSSGFTLYVPSSQAGKNQVPNIAGSLTSTGGKTGKNHLECSTDNA